MRLVLATVQNLLASTTGCRKLTMLIYFVSFYLNLDNEVRKLSYSSYL